jgi:hypothetical protein
MTPEQEAQRAKAIEAMIESACGKFYTTGVWKIIMTAAFDALHGDFTVNAREVTEEMDAAGADSIAMVGDAETIVEGIFIAMAAAGDLTRKSK